jgi:hypothetical protein
MLYLQLLHNLNNKTPLKHNRQAHKQQMMLYSINHKDKQLCNYLIKFLLDSVRFAIKFKDQIRISQVLHCPS